jgi:hypothetical protein
MIWEPEESTESVCVLVVGKLAGGVGKKDGEELNPDGEGNVAGGRTEFGICGDKGDKFVVLIGGTLTDGCLIFLLFIGVNGKGAGKEEGAVFILGESCGLLYIAPGGRVTDGCRGGRVPGSCCSGKAPGCCSGKAPGGCGV